MVRLLPAFLLLLLTLSAPARAELPDRSESYDRVGKVAVGRPIPWFSGWTPENRIVNPKLLQQEGHGATLAIVFATWCVPCRAGLQALAPELPRLQAAGVKVVLVAYQQDAPTVLPWLKALPFPETTVVLDPFGQTAATLGAVEGDSGTTVSLPRSVLWDRTGNVLAIFGVEGRDFVQRVLAAAASSGASAKAPGVAPAATP